jgi:hypothetical protein
VHGLSVIGSAVYGMQPRSPLVIAFSVWWLTHLRAHATWWYDRVILRFGTLFQKKLALAPGMIDVGDVDEVLVACRRGTGPPIAG